MNEYSVIISNKAHSDIAECVGRASKEAAIKLTNDI